jgi:hypothetical protein
LKGLSVGVEEGEDGCGVEKKVGEELGLRRA